MSATPVRLNVSRLAIKAAAVCAALCVLSLIVIIATIWPRECAPVTPFTGTVGLIGLSAMVLATVLFLTGAALTPSAASSPIDPS